MYDDMFTQVEQLIVTVEKDNDGNVVNDDFSREERDLISHCFKNMVTKNLKAIETVDILSKHSDYTNLTI